MRPEIGFVLENAAWPAMLVEANGAIRRANRAALAAFHVSLAGRGTNFKTLWAEGNSNSAEHFLTQGVESEAAQRLRLIHKSGLPENFTAFLTPLTRDDYQYFVLQLFPENLAPTSATAPSVPPPAPVTAGISAPLPPPPPVVEPTPAPVTPASVAVTSETNETAASNSLDVGLAHKQKLDCALQLARSVALDFNNALTSILGHTSLLLAKAEANHPWRSSLVEVEKSAAKAAEIANDLAAFSRQDKDDRTQTAGSINAIIERTVEAFQKPSGTNLLWTMQLEQKIYSATFDEAKMQQAFVKILDNAVQAIKGDGRITVKTSNQSLSDPRQDGTVVIAPGHYVCVEISDNGCGIPGDVLPRIFEPFFTTKPSPPHRGLGLAWVYGIITNHGGSVAVTSQPGQGTSVRVYLPAKKKIVKHASLKDEELRGTETILMVDDEDLLLTMGEMILTSFGYKVLTANNGQKALEIFEHEGMQIDLVITDLVMPHMSGRELIERLRRLSSTVKIIRSTGYTRSGTQEEDDNYLQKPFTSQDLLRKVKQALEGNEGT